MYSRQKVNIGGAIAGLSALSSLTYALASFYAKAPAQEPKKPDVLLSDFTFVSAPSKQNFQINKDYQGLGIQKLTLLANERAKFLSEIRGSKATRDKTLSKDIIAVDQKFKDDFAKITASLLTLPPPTSATTDEQFSTLYQNLRDGLAKEYILLYGERYDVPMPEGRTTLNFNYRVYTIHGAQKETQTVWGEKLQCLVINLDKEHTSFDPMHSRDTTSSHGSFAGLYIQSESPTIFINHSDEDTQSEQSIKEHEFGHLHDLTRHKRIKTEDPFLADVLQEQYAYATELSRLSDPYTQLEELQASLKNSEVEKHEIARRRAGTIFVNEVLKAPQKFGLDPKQFKTKESIIEVLPTIYVPEEERAKISSLVLEDIKKTRKSIESKEDGQNLSEYDFFLGGMLPAASFLISIGLFKTGKRNKALEAEIRSALPVNERSRAPFLAHGLFTEAQPACTKARQDLYRLALQYPDTTEGKELFNIFTRYLPYESVDRLRIIFPVLMERKAIKELLTASFVDAMSKGKAISQEQFDEFAYTVALYGKKVENSTQSLIKYGLQESLEGVRRYIQ